MKMAILKVVLAALLATSVAYGQTPAVMGGQMWTTTGVIAGLSESGLRISQHKLVWKVMSGTVSTCTVQIQTSADNVTFANVGSAQTCTSDGTYTLFGTSANFFRYNLSVFTGTSSPQIGIGLMGFGDTSTGGPLNGTVISATITPAATAATIGVAVQTFTFTGLVSGDLVVPVSYPAATALCPATTFRATAADTLSIGFSVMTASACTPVAGSYSVLVLR